MVHAALLEELLVGDPEWERQQQQLARQQSREYDDRERSPGVRSPAPPRTNALSEADSRQLLARVASDDDELLRVVFADYDAHSKVLLSALILSQQFHDFHISYCQCLCQ